MCVYLVLNRTDLKYNIPIRGTRIKRQNRWPMAVCVPLSPFQEVFMQFIISRLAALDIPNAAEIVADCVDFGRVGWLLDYVNAREAMVQMEVDTYVR